MVIYKKIDWETFSGTWLIASKLTVEQVQDQIKADPKKYGPFEDWKEVKDE